VQVSDNRGHRNDCIVTNVLLDLDAALFDKLLKFTNEEAKRKRDKNRDMMCTTYETSICLN